jgi:hypothetical protein
MSLHALRRWRSRTMVRLCLFAAVMLLAIVQCLHRYGMLQPLQIGRLLGISSRLTEAGLHAWRSRQH